MATTPRGRAGLRGQLDVAKTIALGGLKPASGKHHTALQLDVELMLTKYGTVCTGSMEGEDTKEEADEEVCTALMYARLWPSSGSPVDSPHAGAFEACHRARQL